MGREEVFAHLWTCDYCGRQKILTADDPDPPYDWIEEDVLTFCCWAHQRDWHKKMDKK